MFGFRAREEGDGFDANALLLASDRASAKALEKSAAYVWKVARNSLKLGKQKPIKSLSEDELKAYRIAQKKFKAGELKEKPKRPTQPSKPGEPPRMQRPAQMLKVFLLFAQDGTSGRWVIGSARLPRRGLAPKTLEQGGDADIGRKHVQIAPRPYMVPAMNKEKTQMAKRWENSIRK